MCVLNRVASPLFAAWCICGSWSWKCIEEKTPPRTCSTLPPSRLSCKVFFVLLNVLQDEIMASIKWMYVWIKLIFVVWISGTRSCSRSTEPFIRPLSSRWSLKHLIYVSRNDECEQNYQLTCSLTRNRRARISHALFEQMRKHPRLKNFTGNVDKIPGNREILSEMCKQMISPSHIKCIASFFLVCLDHKGGVFFH